MRVNPISIANCRPQNYKRNHNISMPKHEINFKSWQGAAGSTIGTLAGIGLGVLTGGLGGILFAAMAGCGIGGALGESHSKPVDEYSDDIPYQYKYD